MKKFPLVVGRVVLQQDFYVPAELAEEMLQNFYSLLTYVQAHYPQNLTLINMIQNAIKKAEGV